MAFRTDLAVEAIENHKTAAALPHVRQSDRTLEGFAVHEVRILSEDAAREIGKPQGRYLTLELDAHPAVRRTHFRVPARRSAHCCVNCCRVRMTVRCSSPDWATA